MNSKKCVLLLLTSVLALSAGLVGCRDDATTRPSNTIVKTTSFVTPAMPNPPIPLKGAGGTFPALLYTKWFDQFNQLYKVQINYNAIGSGGGISAITAGSVDFGASDGIMTDAQVAAARSQRRAHSPYTNEQRLDSSHLQYRQCEIG